MVRRNAAVNGVLRTALLRLRCDVLYDLFFSEVFLTLRSFSLAPPVPSRSSLTPRRAAAALAPCSIVWT